MIKTTKKDFELFKSECEKWINFFGLNEWDIKIEHSTDEKYTCGYNWKHIDNLNAVLTLSTDWDDEQCEYSKDAIKRTAFHEVCEILIGKMSTTCLWSFSDREVQVLSHDIIHKLENSVFKHFNK